MAKKKIEYKTEHVLTLEKARELFWMFVTGLVIVGLSLWFAYMMVGSDCCGTNEPCSFATGLGMFILWAIIVLMFLAGIMLTFAFLWDDTGTKKIKIKCDAVSEDSE